MHSDYLDPDIIQERLSNVAFVTRIHAFETLSSTSDVAKRLAASEARHGTLVIADRQTTGRGQHGRYWHSPPGVGLWFSLVLQFPRGANLQTLPLFLSEKIAVALQNLLNVEFHVKWPNDLLFHGKKISGVLCEAGSSNNGVDYVVAGIGINVNHEDKHFPDDLRQKATSLFAVAGRKIDRLAVLAAILAELDKTFSLQNAKHLTDLSQWRKMCPDIGKSLRLRLNDAEIEGVFKDVDDDGALLLETSGGRVRRFLAGEITVLRDGQL